MTCVDKPSLPGDLCIFRSACHRKPASCAEREPESHLPIPDEPRKRKTRGCSSSYQPFSFLLMAAEREGGGAFYLTGLLTVCGGRPRGGRCPRNHHDRVGMRGGSETCGGEKTEPETSTKIPTMPLSTASPRLQSVGPLAGANRVSLPGAAMAKSV